MKRNIYRVEACVVDANGTFNDLSGYPVTVDSRSYDNNPDITYQRAYGKYCETISAMSKVDTRQLQVAMLIHVNTGVQLDRHVFGEIADVPDPEPEGNDE